MPGSEILLQPQSKEAEDSVVGAVLINPAALDTVEFLEPNDFYFSRPRMIWDAIMKLRAEQAPVDFMTVSNKLASNGSLDLIGGPSELASLINNVAYSFNLEAYAKIVKEKSNRRALLDQANKLAAIAYDETKPTAEPVGEVMTNLVKAARANRRGLRHISYGLRENLEYVDLRRQNPTKIWGIKTGFLDFDEYTGGLHPAETTYIAGQPGSGKTKLGTQMICQAALPENGRHPGAIFSFEMAEAQIIKRIISTRQHISTYQMDSGIMTDEIYQAYLDDIAEIEALPIYISDRSINPMEFRAELAWAIDEYGIETYLLDYLLLMPGYENLEETARSGVLSRMVKQTTKDLGLAGITVASTNKEIFGSDSDPSMKVVRGSANVVFDADNITILTSCTEAGKQNISNLTFVKTRNVARPTSKIELIVDNTYPIFRNVASSKTVNLNHFK